MSKRLFEVVDITEELHNRARVLEGVVKKLSEVNKYKDTKGRLHILHCDCLKDSLFFSELALHSSQLSYYAVECRYCSMAPWANDKLGLVLPSEGNIPLMIE